MKRNLMNELKEGMHALSERRNIMNEKDFNDLIASVKEAGAILRNEKCKNMTKVYIVIGHSNIYGSDVHSVHQTKESAEMQQQFLEESDNKEEGKFYLVEVFEVENMK